jgi:peptidoglycan/LPS O-acetylase OafA/YrhL
VTPQHAPRLTSIDVLRGIAILLVLGHHIRHWPTQSLLSVWTIPAIGLDFGYLGVHLFLIISGFCIHYRVAKNMGERRVPAVDMVRFWKRRSWRLYPPYIIAAGISLLFYYTLINPEILDPSLVIHSLPWDIGTHVLMIHNLFADYKGGLGNGVFWTLALEEQLYLLYIVYLWMRRRMSASRTFWIIFAITMAWRFLSYVIFPGNLRAGSPPLEIGDLTWWPFGYWWFWILGAYAAEAQWGVIRVPEWCYRRVTVFVTLALGAVLNECILGRVVRSNWLAAKTGWDGWIDAVSPLLGASDVLIVIGFFSLMCGWLRAESLGNFGGRTTRLLAKIGIISYSLYLTHFPIILVAESYGLEWGLRVGPWWNLLRFAIFVPLCIVLALVYYYLIEKRFLNRPVQTSS